MPRDLPAPGADLPEPSSGAANRTDRISGPEVKARLLDLAATRARDGSEPVDSADPVDSAGSVDPGRSGSRDVPHSRAESKAQALDRRVLGDQVSPADVDRSPPAVLPREPTSAERKVALLDRAHERAKRNDQVAASDTDTDTARPADRRPPIPEKTFNHLLDGAWSRKGRPVGFHSAPGGFPPADRRLTWTGEPSRSGEYEAKVEFWDESAAEWRPKKVPTHTMFPDSWNTEKVRKAVEETYAEVYDQKIEPALEEGRDVSKEILVGSHDGVQIQFYVGPDGTVRTAFPIKEDLRDEF
ncbi:EndoU domain-containing protein [Frankia tisae]|uniref:EndoU domain-containing protein n=1 Tax=Frankia tisae TaxID=2950104 RepID=UPI0021C17462|nr:EndoU domain-containing protein [Frankia tisae]